MNICICFFAYSFKIRLPILSHTNSAKYKVLCCEFLTDVNVYHQRRAKVVKLEVKLTFLRGLKSSRGDRRASCALKGYPWILSPFPEGNSSVRVWQCYVKWVKVEKIQFS